MLIGHHVERSFGLPYDVLTAVSLPQSSRFRIVHAPPLDPDVADVAPTAPALTDYDERHLVTYLRLLDAETNGADWKEVAKIVLHLDPDRSPDRARRAWKTHLTRAHWITEHGYRHLLRGEASR
jgi:hypothetical protein